MPTLSNIQIQKFCSIHGGDNGWIAARLPAGYVGPLTARMPLIQQRSCSNWALAASMQDDQNADNSPEILYVPLNPRPLGQQERMVMPNPPASEPTAAAEWLAAKDYASSNAVRIAFMTTMGRATARLNNLTPSLAPTPYKIHLTAKRHQWYSWDHWAISITDGTQTRFIQTETESVLAWGHTRIWEANRENNIEASFYIQGLHREHIEVIEEILKLPMCRICHRVKPATTSTTSRWHMCAGPGNHVFCGTCAANHLRWNGLLSRTRKCNAAFCDGVTQLMGD